MCKINGFINFGYTKKQAKNIISKMSQQTSPTPLELQIFNHEQICMGDQALRYTYRGQTYTIVYQGNLDNLTALCLYLKRHQIQIKDGTDAEIIVKLYALLGVKMLHKIQGNFAFAIYENTHQRLFLARDQLGIMPLFYALSQNSLAFSAKISALVVHPTIRTCVNLDGLRELFGVCPARTPGKTVYKNIYEIKPGEYGYWQNGKLTTKTYFKFKSQPHTDNVNATTTKIRKMLTKAVHQHSSSQHRVGLMLSGGLDSSAITALTAQTQTNLKTFSVDYVGNQENFKPTDFSPSRDNYYIDLVAKRYKTQHNFQLLNSADLSLTLHEALIARDYPSMADIDSSLLLFCRALKEHIDVCLSGEFADEIFCGYPWFYRQDTHQATTFPWAIDLTIRENTVAKHLKNKLQLKKFVTQSFNDAVAEVPLCATDTPADQQMKTYSYLTMRWFGLNLLERGERMATRCNLQIRMPFTNLKLAQYVYNIPWTMKNHNNQEKGILRTAMQDILPKEVINRKKCPYPKTVDPIYTHLIEQRIRALLTDEEHPVWQIVNMDYVSQVLNNTTTHSTRPWFGQLMQRPQYLAFIYQIAMWLVEYQVQLDLPNR